MRYCRFLLRGSTGDEAPCFGQVEEVNGEPAITALLTLPEAAVPLSNSNKYLDWKPLPLKVAKLLAPVVPSKIVCVGRNYREHASELGNEVPKEPLIFFKPPSAVIGPDAPIKLPPAELTQRVDYEGELGVVIGSRCRNLSEKDYPMAYVRGFTCVNDVTARDMQKKDSQWTRAKGFDTFCPVGPIVVDKLDLGDTSVETFLNGERKQHGNTREFIFNLEQVIRYIS